MKRKTPIHGKIEPLISVIVPVYKEEGSIVKRLGNIKRVMDKTGKLYEIICVVDGKVDRTYEHARKFAKKHQGQIRVVGYLTNLGKGHAVRYGMAKAKGDIIAFIDAGDIDTNSISMLLEHFKWYDADVIIGSKRHPVSRVEYPWQRKILSFGYQMLVRVLFDLKVRDTQVGLKLFKREVLEETLPRLLVKAFAMDIEMLAVANYLGFKKIYEAPVDLKMEFGGTSTLASKGFAKTIFSMLWDTAAVFYRLRILDYYNSKNKKNWITPDYLTLNNKK